ncbi:SPX domain-containing protein [Glomus cerebriforme]|uniref:SPX domain-containing protein n=1 Tax=Glomus cerebriforme TaxID=658196 RepID=A0A397SUZ9_9GLOM|nr:SPX domain-containing protein [Glomus cerebriforme]
MKFEKRFQAEIVPEWRIKYINYKGLKKRLRYIRREKIARDKEFMQNNHESNRISVFSHNIDSIHPEGTGIQSPNYDKRTSIQSQQRTFTINSVTDSVQDFFHKVSSALVTIQRQQSLSHHSHRHSIPPPPPQITSLDTLMDQVNTEERLFFTALDGELEKINHFYKIKEIEATNRMTMLIQQYEMLKEKKDEKKQSFETWKNTSNLVKQSIDYLTSPNTSSIYLEKSSTGIGLMDERQIYYKTAKKNIKKAVFEFYRGAELLRKYKTLNYNGFSKILKKYDMISERNGSEIYMQKVKNSYFVKSENIKKLLKDAEDFYVTHFEGGSRSKAIRRLRTPNKENKVKVVLDLSFNQV